MLTLCVRRHRCGGPARVLRTTVDGIPFQQVHAVGELAERLDWQVVEAQSDVEAAVLTGFDLVVDLPIRVRLWRAGSG